jgi:hypothetical protein
LKLIRIAIAHPHARNHNALAPFSSRIGRSGFSRAAENIAYGHADFASTLKQWTNSSGHRANLLLHGAKWVGVAHAHGQWSSGRNKSQCGFICRAVSAHTENLVQTGSEKAREIKAARYACGHIRKTFVSSMAMWYGYWQ